VQLWPTVVTVDDVVVVVDVVDGSTVVVVIAALVVEMTSFATHSTPFQLQQDDHHG
jgi:hypothetical protein